MEFRVPGLEGFWPPMNTGLSAHSFSDESRVIGIEITFNTAGKPPIHRSFLRSACRAVHLGREPADARDVANAFGRGDVVPPVMSRKHAEIVWVHDAPQVMDIGSYHGTYFQGVGQRLEPNKPYPLWDGSVLEFGKSVTKDDKAHEPLMATIKFIYRTDSIQREPSGLFSPASPPRRYGIPSDSEGEEDEDLDEDEDEDESETSSVLSSRSDVFEYTPEGLSKPHIDLTGSDDETKYEYSTAPDTDGIECIGFGYTPTKAYVVSESGSDMSESEYEDDVAPPPPRPALEATHVPVLSVDTVPRGLGEGESNVSRATESDAAPGQDVRGLRAELEKAMDQIVGLKAELERKDKDGDVQIVEPVNDVPSRIANIEQMVHQLVNVGDAEICLHRSAVQDMLAQLSDGISALRIRVGGESVSSGTKRKRDDEDDDEIESRRAQSPMPVVSVSRDDDPIPSSPPAKRSRISASALGAVVGGAAVWSALAFNVI